MAADTHHMEEEHGLTPRQYVLIGIILSVITFAELAASLWLDLGELLIPVLIVLSAVKFAAVVAFFMHLYFEKRLLTQVFVGSFVLAGAMLIALISIFWTDITSLI